MGKIIYNKGDFLGDFNIMFLEDSEDFFENGRKRRGALFKCHCGNNYKTRVVDVKNNKSKSCGCSRGGRPNKYEEGQYINNIKFLRSCGTTNYAQRAIFECPICKKEWESFVGNIQAGHTKSCCNKNQGWWTKEQWVKISDTSTFYVVLMFNNKECFIKVGMTTKKLDHRLKNVPYNYVLLRSITKDSAYIFDLEKRFIRLFKDYKYVPNIEFSGSSECLIIKI